MSTDKFPRARTAIITLSSGEAVTVKPFDSLQVLEDDRLADAFAQIFDIANALGQQSYADYRKKVLDAGLTLDQAANLPDDEAAARGLVVQHPSTPRIIAACRAPLSRLVRAAVPRSDDWYQQLPVDELLALIGAVYAVNAEQYQGKLTESLLKLQRALAGTSAAQSD